MAVSSQVGSRRLATRGRHVPPAHPAFQRLVANPFLAFFALVVWYAALRASVEAGRAGWFLGVFASGVLVPFLFQFHCLDCGRTGHVLRSSGHACASVTARRDAGRPRRFRGPTPVAQTKLWVLALVAAACFLFAVA